MSIRPDILGGHPGGVVLRLVLPMISASISIALFQVVDTYFVGRLGALQLAAMGFSFPVVIAVNSIAIGLGIGASASVAQSLGAGNRDYARRITTDAHLLVLVAALFLTAAGLATIDPFFTALGADARVLPYVRDYMTIWYAGIPLMIVPMISQNVIQGTGDTKTPGLFIAAVLGLNCVLDPLLMFGLGPFPALGLQGAAVATVAARGSLLIIFTGMVLGRRERLFAPILLKARTLLSNWWHVLYIGLPAAAINVLLPISVAILTRLIADFGPRSVAGFGVGVRVEAFAIVFMIALSMVIPPFVGQNWGAGKPARIAAGYRYAALYSLVWGAMTLAVFASAAGPIAGVFTDDAGVSDVAARYLTILSLTYGFQGIVIVTSAAFTGLRKPLNAAGVSFLRLIVFYVPFALAGRELYGLSGIFIGAAVGNVLSGIAAFLWFQHYVRRSKRAAAAGAEDTGEAAGDVGTAAGREG